MNVNLATLGQEGDEEGVDEIKPEPEAESECPDCGSSGRNVNCGPSYQQTVRNLPGFVSDDDGRWRVCHGPERFRPSGKAIISRVFRRGARPSRFYKG